MKIKIAKFFSILFVCVFFVSLLFGGTVKAETNLDIYMFWGDGCPHCEKESKFLNELLPSYPNISLNKYEVYYNKANSTLMKKVSSELGSNVSGIPYLIIGDKEFVGFSEGITDKEIKDRIEECVVSTCPDSISSIINDNNKSDEKDDEEQKNQTIETKESKIISLPFIGKINTIDFSLPLLTIIMGVLDGFNPCAMWVLLFLISLLLGFNDRRKMWILGSIFIFASAFCYFLFMAAWLNLIIFIGYVSWIRIIIGLVALIGGAYSFKKGIENKDGGCEVTNKQERKVVFEKLREIASRKNLLIAIGGIILLAFAVNLVELVCSAGLPAIYTQVLTLSHLENWQYYGYILLYILFFMIDDLIIFIIAMITLKMTGISTKYSRYSSLIGGGLMLIIGLLLIFKPEILMFG